MKADTRKGDVYLTVIERVRASRLHEQARDAPMIASALGVTVVLVLKQLSHLQKTSTNKLINAVSEEDYNDKIHGQI